MDILRIGALGIVAAVLSLVIKQYRPELALQIALALGVVVFLFLSAQLSGISAVVSSLFAKADIQPDYFLTILKATGIAFITEFAGATCKDAGEVSIAQKIEIGGKVLIVFLALPLLMSLLQQLLGLMQQGF
jgi:stage III sporulation protein AD